MPYIVRAHPFVFGRDGACSAILEDPDKRPPSCLGHSEAAIAIRRRAKLAWDGFVSGPFDSRSTAESACAQMLSTGRFFQVRIETFEDYAARVLARVRSVFGDTAPDWLATNNEALAGRQPLTVLLESPQELDAALDTIDP